MGVLSECIAAEECGSFLPVPQPRRVTADAAHLGLFPLSSVPEGVREEERRCEKLVSLLKGCLQGLQIKLALQQSAHSPISRISLRPAAPSTCTNAAELTDSMLISPLPVHSDTLFLHDLGICQASYSVCILCERARHTLFFSFSYPTHNADTIHFIHLFFTAVLCLV